MRPLLRCSPLLLVLALVGCGPEDGDDGDTGPAGEPASAGIELEFVGRFQHLDSMGGVGFDVGAAEIPAFDHLSERLVVVNALRGGVDVIDASDPTALALVPSGLVDVAALVETAQSLAPGSLAGVNSVNIYNGIAAVAVEANPKTGNGYIAFINCATLALVGSVQVGALPDMVTFSPDGARVLVANEGEPSNNYAENPAGTVSIISVTGGFAAPTVQTVDFTDWDVGGARNSEVAGLVTKGLRFNTVTGAAATFSDDMEPEYIAVSGGTAYVTLQENNAIAVIDLATATVTTIHALGFKDYGLVGNEADLGERDVDGSSGAGGLINLRTWGGVYGAYMPDAITAYSVGSKTYLVTANEGDAREWPGATFADVDRLSTIFNGGNPLTGRLTGLEGNVNLGRLNILKDISTSSRVVTMGARSFSIWDAATGTLVFDSGSGIEQKIAQRYPQYFNVSSTNNTLDNRSDDKGPEPEGVCIGTIGTTTYAFIGLERIGGIMVYDITNPQAAKFVSYRNDRDFTETPAAGTGGDLAPEGMVFVPAERSPTGTALVVVGFETSGTTVVYEVGDLLPPDANG